MADNTNTVNPANSAIYFAMLTIVFSVVNIFMINSANTLEAIEDNKNNIVYTLIYMGLVLSGTYFINLKISSALCPDDGIQHYNVFFATVLPWLIIFVILYFLLELFPGWVAPFSNTIGYLVVKILGVETFLENVLNKEPEQTIVSAIDKIKSHKAKIINEFDDNRDNFENFFKKFKQEKLTNINIEEDIKTNEDIIQLFKLINIKFIVGKMVWYILAGTIVASISYNYIVNMSCQKTVEDIQNDIDELQEENEEDDEGSD
jgi:hypothetical protein